MVPHAAHLFPDIEGQDGIRDQKRTSAEGFFYYFSAAPP
jgi:hypothetical protein